MGGLKVSPVERVDAEKFRDPTDFADLCDPRRPAPLVPTEHSDRRACRCEPLRDRAAQHACAAHDDRHLSGKVKWIFHIPV